MRSQNYESKKDYYEKNRDKIREQQRLYYQANKDKIRAAQKAYKNRKTEEDGINPGTRSAAKWRKEYPEKYREVQRKSRAKIYRADPFRAAKKRAISILCLQTGLKQRQLGKSLVEAKAMQLLVWQHLRHPDRPVGYVMTSEERLARSRESARTQYAKRKARKKADNAGNSVMPQSA